jgi:hypothetical protein
VGLTGQNRKPRQGRQTEPFFNFLPRMPGLGDFLPRLARNFRCGLLSCVPQALITRIENGNRVGQTFAAGILFSHEP